MPITALPRRGIIHMHIAIKAIRAYKTIRAIRVIKDKQRDVL